MKFPYTWYEMSWSLLSLCRTVWTLTLNVLWDFPPTHTPLYSIEGWKPGTAVPGLLHLQGKGTEIFENRSIEFVPGFSRCEFTVLCRIYKWFTWTGYFRIQSGFMVEKKNWARHLLIFKSGNYSAHFWQIPNHHMLPVFQQSYVVPPALRRMKRMFQM